MRTAVIMVAVLVSCSGTRAPGPASRQKRVAASAFTCVQDECIQRWPRLPDVHEWDCQSANGPVVCRFQALAAGLEAQTTSTGFVCGPRLGHANETLCRDVEPDVPVGEGPWQCRFEASDGSRVCVKNPQANLPTPLVEAAPNCWLDADCGGPRCVAGVCVAP